MPSIRFVIALLASLSLVMQGVGQTFSAQTSDTFVVGSSDSLYFDVFVDLFQHDTTDMIIAWERINEQVPPEWTLGVCIGTTCYPPSAVNGTYLMRFQEPFNPVSVQFYPFSTPGVGETTIRLFHVGGNDTLIIRFEGTALTTTIPERETVQISAGPNPFTGVVQLSRLPGHGTIRMVDLTGKICLETTFTSPNLEIGTAHLPEGIYLLQIEGNSWQRTLRLVKD